MNRVLKGSRIAEIDSRCIQDGVDSRRLMQNAGSSVAKAVKAELKGKKNAAGVVVCGGGNNGGDGFVAASDLIKSQIEVKVFYITPTEKFSSDSAHYFEQLNQMAPEHVFFLNVENSQSWDYFLQELDTAYFVIDAIFGTGLHGKDIYGPAKKIIETINDRKKAVYSVDIPSGIDSDNGKVLGVAIKADATITFGCKKLGLLNYPGAGYAGRVKVVDIGIPEKYFEQYEQIFETGMDWVGSRLPRRKAWSYKHSVGKLLVVAGSVGLTGAATMTCNSAMRAGAGLVTLVCPWELNPILEQKLTEVMTYPVDQTDDLSIHYDSLEEIVELSSKYDALAIGPGISKNSSTIRLVRELLKRVHKPTVLDADGLAAIYGVREVNNDQYPDFSHVIITPHAGELSLIMGMNRIALEQRYEVNIEAAGKFNLVSVLKGARTLITKQDGTTFINNTGDWALSTAGTGDILTGIISSLICQGMDNFNAAVCGTYIHGLASDMISRQTSRTSMVATDLLEGIKKVFLKLEKIIYEE
ncbi:MAG: NAD(P)H-hydrate dehydratase [Actinomycetia bacterium]|nr:NAD(P)H-hydrate dehydratase [Actinomycetes bacterium]